MDKNFPANIEMRPIGYVSSPAPELVDEKWGEVLSRIVLDPEYAGGLSGLEGFSHAIIVTLLHEAGYVKERHLKRRPRGLASMPEVGIFSQRAKDRPNPIGITTVEIIGVGIDYLEVKGLDAVNGTPVLDIKPYYPHYDRIEAPVVPEWVDRLMKDYF
jgi:tRNA-Thr(GGU) m(6)t(6)A37 methyltransferase TsaA